MPTLDDTQPSHLRRSVLWISGALGVGCILFWIVLIPYAAGHGDGRERMIVWLARHWSTPTWIHGAFVPLAALVMAWVSRKRLKTAAVSPSPLGALTLAFGFLLLWAGYRTHVVYFGIGGIHLLIVGFILWFFGWKHLRILAYPILFLLLAWPLPFLEATLSFHLRILMTDMSGGLINFFGGEVTPQGTALVWDSSTGIVHMEVEGACSGLRSLFSLFAAAALIGFFTLRRTSHRILLLLAAIPLAIVGNIARLIALYIGVHTWGWETAIGELDSPSTFHLFAGVLAIAVGLAGTVWIATALRNRGKKPVRIKITSSKDRVPTPTHVETGSA